MLGNVRINAEAAACQIIDGEAVLIHFDSGRYFSSLGSGSEVIRPLELGHTVEQIAGAFRRHYAAGPEVMEQEIASFVEELVLENLFVSGAPGGTTNAELVLDVAAEFQPPKLEKYSELEDLLKLDPIHDVNPAGWPLREAQQVE